MKKMMMVGLKTKITTKVVSDLFDEDEQFHFNQGPEYDDGDDYQDHYRSDDNSGEEKDRDESTLEGEV